MPKTFPEPLSKEEIQKVLTASLENTNEQLHACRHMFNVRYLVNGGNAFRLQKILGHTSLEMTQKYVNLASGDVKKKHRKFSPMDNLNFRSSKRGRPKLKSTQ